MVLVKVEFTIDIGIRNDKNIIFEAQDIATDITKEVFNKSFSRAHLIKIETEELMELSRDDKT